MSLGLVDSVLGRVKGIFTKDTVKTDNPIFSLHKKFTFAILLAGLIFISSQNYLNSNAITCINENAFVKDYCFLHGMSHINTTVHSLDNSNILCRARDAMQAKKRSTSYYIWLPFVLTLCAAITQLPGILWSNFFEAGRMGRMVDELSKTEEKDVAKLHNIIRKNCRKGSYKAHAVHIYNLGFALCEVLNIVAIILIGHILNSILIGSDTRFSNYGVKQYNYKPADLTTGPDFDWIPSPMCDIFPTEVSCDVPKGGLAGGIDETNTLCLLSNNLFNQYFFLILWFWGVILLAISGFGLVYRAVQLSTAGIGRYHLRELMKLQDVGEGVCQGVETLDLGVAELFFLNRLLTSMKGSQTEAVLKALIEEDKKVVRDENSTKVEIKDNKETEALLMEERKDDKDRDGNST